MTTEHHPPEFAAAQTVLTLGLAVLLAVGFFIWLEENAGHHDSRQGRRGYGRAGDLKQIGLGLLMYSGEYSGNFPPSLWTLHDTGILNAGLLASPADLPDAGSDPAGFCDRYYYLGAGLRDDTPNATNRPLLVYPFQQVDGLHVSILYVDGHVELRYHQEPASILALIAGAQPAPPEAQP